MGVNGALVGGLFNGATNAYYEGQNQSRTILLPVEAVTGLRSVLELVPHPLLDAQFVLFSFCATGKCRENLSSPHLKLLKFKCFKSFRRLWSVIINNPGHLL